MDDDALFRDHVEVLESMLKTWHQEGDDASLREALRLLDKSVHGWMTLYMPDPEPPEILVGMSSVRRGFSARTTGGNG